jgi:hypothetical protein
MESSYAKTYSRHCPTSWQQHACFVSTAIAKRRSFGGSMVSDLSQYLGTVTLAVGALGTASYGVIDGMKLIPWVDLAGFERLFSSGGAAGGRMWPTKTKAGLDPLLPALTAAYGADAMDLLKTQYRAGRTKGDLPRTLRQGVRI